MSALTDFFERQQRNAYHRRGEPRWAVIALGIFVLVLGAAVSIAHHRLYNGRFFFALGLALGFVGVTEYVLRDSPWRWATRVVALGMWCVALWITFHW